MREAEKGEEMKKFWNYVNEYMMKIGKGIRIVLIADMNGRIGRNKVTSMMGKWAWMV